MAFVAQWAKASVKPNLPTTVHLSLHASGQSHMKLRRRSVHQWTKPAEITAGYTRALTVVQPVAVAIFALPVPVGPQLLKLPADAEPTEFDVWIEHPGANLQSWPGKNADGTVLVGRIPLAGDVPQVRWKSAIPSPGDDRAWWSLVVNSYRRGSESGEAGDQLLPVECRRARRHDGRG